MHISNPPHLFSGFMSIKNKKEWEGILGFPEVI